MSSYMMGAMRDMDLHPDYQQESGMQRAKRQLSTSLEEPTRKLRRMKEVADETYANAPSAKDLRAAAKESYANAPSAREVRAVASERVKSAKAKALLTADELAMKAVQAAPELGVVAERTVARAEAVVASVSELQASALQHGAKMEGMVQAGVDALADKATQVARSTMLGAVNYLTPRLTWSSSVSGVLGGFGLTKAAPKSKMSGAPLQAENVPPPRGVGAGAERC